MFTPRPFSRRFPTVIFTGPRDKTPFAKTPLKNGENGENGENGRNVLATSCRCIIGVCANIHEGASMADKIDHKKLLKHLYHPPKAFTVVDVPPMSFLMIDGSGDPNTSDSYAQAVEALYGLSYALKFAVRKTTGVDYTVMPLEGLWWADDMDDFITRNKSAWRWTMMIMQPEPLPDGLLDATRAELAEKKAPPALDRVRYETFAEGAAVQVMHLGSYDDEAPTIAAMHQYIADNGYALGGHHHEIYLNDPRKTAPDKLKTVLRQPVRRL
jgi:hypothetical protein